MKQSPGQLGDNVSRSRLGRRMFLRRLLTRVGKRRNGQGNIEIFICSRNVISSFAQGPKIRRRKMAETKWSEIEHSRTPMVQNSVESEQYTYGLGGHERLRDLRLRLATRGLQKIFWGFELTERSHVVSDYPNLGHAHGNDYYYYECL